jgi:hypothetical protein
MRSREGLGLGLTVALVAVTVLTVVLPPIDDFELENPFWNGLSEVNSLLSPTRFSDLQDVENLSPERTSLLLIGPSKPFTDQEATSVQSYLEKGGFVLLADDIGSGDNLLSKLDVEITFSEAMMRDPLFRDVDSDLPRIMGFQASSLLSNVSVLAFNYPTALIVQDQRASILAYSSFYSYLDEDGDSFPDEEEATGPFPVFVDVAFGDGVLLVVSDSSLFINSVLGKDDNQILLTSLVGDKTVYVEDSHWRPSPFTQYKLALGQVYHYTSLPEIKYSLLVMVLLTAFKAKWKKKGQVAEELETVLRIHPEWDRNLLTRLKEGRESVGSQ